MLLFFNLYQSFFFGTIALAVTFFTVWLSYHSYSEESITNLLLTISISRLFGFLFIAFWIKKINLSDDRKITWSLILCFLLAWSLFLVNSPLVFFFLYPAFIFFFALNTPLLESFMSKLSNQINLPYPIIRRWGALAFLLVTFGAGLVFDLISIKNYPLIFIAFIFSSFLCFLFFKVAKKNNYQIQKSDLEKNPTYPKVEDQKEAGISFNLNNFLILLLAFILIGSHAGHLNLSSLIWHEQGWSFTLIGFLWAVGVISEFILFSIKKLTFDRFQIIRKYLMIAIIITSLRWMVQGAFIDNFVLQFIAQVLHGFSFALSHSLFIAFMKVMLPEAKFNSFQGWYFLSSFGLGFLFFTFLTNYLYINFSIFSMYFITALLVLASVFLCLLINRKTKAVIKNPLPT